MHFRNMELTDIKYGVRLLSHLRIISTCDILQFTGSSSSSSVYNTEIGFSQLSILQINNITQEKYKTI